MQLFAITSELEIFQLFSSYNEYDEQRDTYN